MLKTSSLHFRYARSIQFDFPDFELSEGSSLLILGESGIGKTTLLHLLGGLLTPNSGRIELGGTLLSHLPSEKADQFRGKNIGLIFQRPHFIRSMTLRGNMSLIQHLGKQSKDRARINEIAKNLGLTNKLSSLPYHLSQGEQQRAAIGLALLNKPQLILADEPTSSLDDKNCSKVCALLKEQAKSTQAKMVIITHDQRLKAEFQNVISL